MEQNSYPMREWHVKHMENTLIKFVTGLSEDASRWEKRMNNKYGRIGRVCKRIEYDIKHGVTNSQVCSFLQLLGTGSSFSEVRTRSGSIERLSEIQAYFKETDSESEYPRYADMRTQRNLKLLVDTQRLT
ncbi:MAG TPA: hypothetical protein VF884_04250 [Nitrososphaeraceae archaeon]